MSKDFIVVFVAVGQEKEAELIARTLVNETLAACVGMVQQKSFYYWKGETIEDKEILLIIKTKQTQFAPLRDRVLALHSYEVPEIISIPIQDGHGAYLEWIATNVDK
jgi:periplasmic divalent cation tolerance protein